MFEKLDHELRGNVHLMGNNKYFDLKTACIGGFVMGGLIYYLNSDYGFEPAMIAAGKQAMYTFSAGGFVTRLTEYMATNYENSTVSKIMAGIVPTALTIAATYLLHTIRGTPEPELSTVPTMLIAPTACSIWGYKTRLKLERLILNEEK